MIHQRKLFGSEEVRAGSWREAGTKQVEMNSPPALRAVSAPGVLVFQRGCQHADLAFQYRPTPPASSFCSLHCQCQVLCLCRLGRVKEICWKCTWPIQDAKKFWTIWGELHTIFLEIKQDLSTYPPSFIEFLMDIPGENSQCKVEITVSKAALGKYIKT